MRIDEIDGSSKYLDMERMFTIHEDGELDGSPYRFNLNSTVYLEGVPSGVHNVTHESFWNTLSYEIYGTTRLWWLLMKLNGVKACDALKPVYAGSSVRYMPQDEVQQLMPQMVGVTVEPQA